MFQSSASDSDPVSPYDRWLDGPRIERALESAGVPVLENEAVKVRSSEVSVLEPR